MCGLSHTSVFSQDKYIDSLKLVLLSAKEDTIKVYKLGELFTLLQNKGNTIKGLVYAEEALSLSKKIKFKKGEALAIQYIGLVYYDHGNYAEAIKNLYNALKLQEEIGDKKGIADSNQFLGASFSEQNKWTEASNFWQESLRLHKELGDKFGVAQTYNGIGDVCMNQGNIQEALKKYLEALNIYREPGAPIWGISWGYMNIGRVYEKEGDIALAQANEQAAGKKYSEALRKYLEALKSREDNKLGFVNESLVYAGTVAMKLKRFSLSRSYLNKSLKLSTEADSKEFIKKSYYFISKLDSSEGNLSSAFENYKMYILYRDSLVNEESIRKSEGYKMQYEVDKKEDQIKLLTTENKLKTTLASKQMQQKNFAYIGIAAILLTGGYGFYRYRRKKKLQSKQAVLNERLRISSELHDEVGATLSGIAMYSHLTKEQIKTGQTAEIEKSLNVMQQSSAQMVDKLNDIVWLINPEQDSLQKLD